MIVVGMDPSMNNWGLARADWSPATNHLTVQLVSITQPVKLKGKQVRQNSTDLVVAQQLYDNAYEFCKGANAVFVEVPHGSQSARAMASYGICVGILAGLRAMGIPFHEVNANEVKLATGLKKTATKRDIINWAMGKHPEANWPMYKRNGEELVSEALAEHQADAVAAIYAGLSCSSFQQMLSFSKSTT